MSDKPNDAARSPHWPHVRAAHLEREPACIVCGTTEHLTVHHVVPFHVDASLELRDENLATMCETPDHNDHLLFGHYLNWHLHDPDVKKHAAEFRKRLEEIRKKGDKTTEVI